MSLIFDLHSHSNRSDGLLSPAELVAHAATHGVDVLALTDHDDVSGLALAKVAAAEHNIQLVNGVEIISGSIIDVTELKQSEKNLRITNEKLKLSELFLNNSTDALQVLDDQGKFVLINEAGAKILGIKKEDVINYTIYDIESLFTSTQMWDDHVTNIKKQGILFAQGVNRNLVTGEYTPIDIRISFVENKGKTFIIASARDISEKKKTELLLLEKQKNIGSLKEIIDLSSIVTFTDQFGIITQANQNFYRISGY